MRAIILAAGRGLRMMPLTAKTPKPLLKIAGVPMIEHIILALKTAAITDIIINVSYLPKLLKNHLADGEKWGVKITYSDETSGALETAGGIIKALPLLGSEAFLAINSDILCDFDLAKLRLAKDQLAHLLLVENPTHNQDGDFSLKDGKITEKTSHSYTFSGIGIYHPDIFQPFLNCKNQKLPLISVLKKAIINHQLSGEYYAGFWTDVGTVERLKQANQSNFLHSK